MTNYLINGYNVAINYNQNRNDGILQANEIVISKDDKIVAPSRELWQTFGLEISPLGASENSVTKLFQSLDFLENFMSRGVESYGHAVMAYDDIDSARLTIDQLDQSEAFILMTQAWRISVNTYFSKVGDYGISRASSYLRQAENEWDKGDPSQITRRLAKRAYTFIDGLSAEEKNRLEVLFQKIKRQDLADRALRQIDIITRFGAGREQLVAFMDEIQVMGQEAGMNNTEIQRLKKSTLESAYMGRYNTLAQVYEEYRQTSRLDVQKREELYKRMQVIIQDIRTLGDFLGISEEQVNKLLSPFIMD